MSPTLAPASLSTLPPELLLRIMEVLPDFRTLYHFISADPRASRLLAAPNTGPRLLDALVGRFQAGGSASIRRMVDNMVQSMRLVALLRSGSSGSPPPPELSAALTGSWAQFRETYILPHPPGQGRKTAPTFSASLNRPVAGSCSARQVLLLARRISCLAAECFDFFIARWMQAKPQHLVNKGDSYSMPLGPSRRIPSWELEYEGYYYEPRPGGPPTGPEMVRITAGLWDLQLAFELKAAAKNARGTACLPWPAQDLQTVTDMAPLDLFPTRSNWFDSRGEGAASVLYFVQNRDEAYRDDPLQLPHPVPSSFTAAGIHGCLWPPEADEKLIGTSPGQGHRWAMVHSTGHIWSPTRLVPFDPFRRLGIGLWCRERLEEFELLGSFAGASRSPKGQLPDVSMPTTSDSFFTWKSLLSEEEVAEVVARLSADARQRLQEARDQEEREREEQGAD